MTCRIRLLLAAFALPIAQVHATTIWEEGHPTPAGGIANPYELKEPALARNIERGKIHALQWPVDVTGPLLPYRPIRCLLDLNCFRWPFGNAPLLALGAGPVSGIPIDGATTAPPYVGPYDKAYVQQLAEPYFSANEQQPDPEALNARLRKLFDAHDNDGAVEKSLLGGAPVPLVFDGPRNYSFDWWTRWLGLYEYPSRQGDSGFCIPYPKAVKPDYRMSVSLIDRDGVQGVTFSCAACHLEELFGRPIIGLTTRFPRANKFIYHSSRLIKRVNPLLFRLSTGASEAEVKMLMDLKPVMQLVDTRVPQTLGLDTALAQVGLSLRIRGLTGKGPQNRTFPVSDSKPSVWWNVKYKNRWLSDGSLASGNPILTNILWNEIGRGSDLVKLEVWLQQNAQTVREMTAMVYASEAPHITDFFGATRIDFDSARRGETLFNEHCRGCHGRYTKNWSADNVQDMTPADRLKTALVEYPEQTKIKDVGTDESRRNALHHLLALNELDIAKTYGVALKVSDGYVPPPLVGIWARWPYFHNNSAPTLCAVLETGKNRPAIYYARPAKDKEEDFDFECNGYPDAPKHAAILRIFSDYRFDTQLEGMANIGHDQGILIEDGQELFSASDKRDLISFLQTL